MDIAIEATVTNPLASVWMAPLAIILLWVVFVSIFRWRRERSHQAEPGWLPLLSFAVVFPCFLSHYAIFWAVDRLAHTATSSFLSLVLLEFLAYSLVLLPILFLSGSDFAEWGLILAGQLNAWLRRPKNQWPLVVATAVVAAAILTWRLIRRGTFAPFGLISAIDLGTVVLIGLVWVLLLLAAAWLGRIATWPRLSIPAGALVTATVATMVLLTGPAYVITAVTNFEPTSSAYAVDYTLFRHPAGTYSRPFSIAYPSGWQSRVSEPKSAQDTLVVELYGPLSAGNPVFLLVGTPTAALGGATPDELAQAIVTGDCYSSACTATLTQVPDHGSWLTMQSVVHDQGATGQPLTRDGWVWQQTQNSTTWALYAQSESGAIATYAPILTAMLDSWRPDLSARTPVAPLSGLDHFLRNVDPTGILSLGVIPILLGLLVGIPLLVRGRRKPGPLAVAGLFFLMSGVTDGLAFYPDILSHFGVSTSQVVLLPLGPQHRVTLAIFPTLSLPVLETVTAFFSLIIIGWLVLRRRAASDQARTVVATALLLNCGLLALSLLDGLFSATDQIAGRFTVAQAVLLVLAFLWDLLTSGKQVTNTDGPRSPRSARVLLYAGVSLLSCSQVLFFSTLGASAGLGLSGDLTNTGLLALGIPLLLTVILLRFGRARQQPTPSMAAAVESTLPLTNVPGAYDTR